MVRTKIDLSGMEFGLWKVINQSEQDFVEPNGKHIAAWICECQCENHTVKIVRGKDLKNGKSKSCGCLQKEIVSGIGKNNSKRNTYNLSGEYGIGYTSKGEEFYFDLEDYEKIKDYCWFIDSHGYVAANAVKDNKRITILFHCLVMNNKYIDHKKHTIQDNRKNNLRIVTHSQNSMNRSIKSNNTSGITGVSWDKKSNKWHSRIGINNKEISLGFYVNINDAVKARKEAEEKYFGEYSYDNSVKE